MARVVLNCPIDGTSLGATNQNITPALRGVPATDPHVHLLVAFDLTCGNGHRWRVAGQADLTIDRVV